MGIYLHIEPAVEQLFQKQGLDNYEALMNTAVGELVSDDGHGREFRRLAIPGAASLYLKRIGQEPLRRVCDKFMGKGIMHKRDAPRNFPSGY